MLKLRFDPVTIFIVVTANSCPNITSPSNGYVNQTTVKFGDSVGYNCSYGYYLAGQPTRRCDTNCIENQCQLSGVKPVCNGTYPMTVLYIEILDPGFNTKLII